ncbi:MAG: acetyl-CoA carboxylase biotin carboxyl carrier protein [Candidatus Coatesbacteria bacterium]
MSRKADSGTGGLTASGMQGIDLGIMRRLLKFMRDAQLTELDIEMEHVKVRLRKGTSPEAGAAPVAMPAMAPMLSVPVAPVAGSVPAGAAGSLPPAGGGGAPAPAAAVAPAAGPAPVAHAGPVVKSPMVGTFYRAPSPTSPPFVNTGDVVKEGQTLCLIEAMKLMNEIKAERAGKITKVLVENGHPVEFDQVLFELEPA